VDFQQYLFSAFPMPIPKDLKENEYSLHDAIVLSKYNFVLFPNGLDA